MPGGTQRFQLPYMLPTEALHTIANVTKLLAERLDTIIASGELNGAPGTPGKDGADSTVPGPPGPPGDRKPTASIVMPQAVGLAGWSTYTPTWTVERDLNSPGGAQASTTGLTVRQAGVYLVTVQFPWEVNLDRGACLQVKLYAAGAQIAASTNIGGTSSPTGDNQPWESVGVISTIVPLAAGDKLTASVIHSGSRTVNAGGTIQGGVKTRLAMTLMAA